MCVLVESQPGLAPLHATHPWLVAVVFAFQEKIQANGPASSEGSSGFAALAFPATWSGMGPFFTAGVTFESSHGQSNSSSAQPPNVGQGALAPAMSQPNLRSMRQQTAQRTMVPENFRLLPTK